MERHGSQTSGFGLERQLAQPYNPYPGTQSTSTEKTVRGCLRGRPLQVASALAANILSLSFGAIVGYSSAVMPELKEHYSESQISWIVTSTMIGILSGSALWSQITPRIGPKNAAIVSGIPMVISWCLLLNIGNSWCVIGGRILNGLGSAGLLSAVPHYISDIAEDSLRGILGSIMVLVFNIGTLIIYALGGYLSAFQLALVCAVNPVVFMVALFLCPESPIFFLKNERADKGRNILARLRYPNDISHELASMGSKTDVETARWADVIKDKAARKTLVISLVMFAIQQISGIIPLLSYVGEIFKRAGGSLDPVIASCIVAAVQIVGSLIGIVIIERAGRRVIMLSSCVIMALSHGFFGYALMPDSNTPGWLPVTCLSVFMIGYAMGAASAPWVIMNELSSPSMRPKIVSLVVVLRAPLSFALVKTFPDMIRVMSVKGVFWMYAAGCAAGAVFTFFFLPETAGKSNASIQEQLQGRKFMT